MPNHVTTIIEVNTKDTDVIKALINENNEVDFNKIVEKPAIFERFGGGVPYLDAVLYADFKRFLNIHNINLSKDDKIKLILSPIFNSVEPTTLEKANGQRLTEQEVENLMELFYEKVIAVPHVYPETHKEFSRSTEFRDTKKSLTDEMVCLALTGDKDPLKWSRNHWGTKWNAYDSDIEKSFRSVKFNTAWSSPFQLITSLSQKFPTAEIMVEYADEDLGNNCGYYTMLNGVILSGDNSDDNAGDWLDFASKLKYGLTYKELQEDWGESDSGDEE